MQASLVDIHCEATSEKMAFGHFCDGRVSAVIGTHTHVPTSDAMILPNGTAYQSDAGMCEVLIVSWVWISRNPYGVL